MDKPYVMHLKGGPCAWEPQTAVERDVTCGACLLHLRQVRAHRDDDLVPPPADDVTPITTIAALYDAPSPDPSPSIDTGSDSSGYSGGGGESGGGGASGEW